MALFGPSTRNRSAAGRAMTVPVRMARGRPSRESRGRRIDRYRPENYATSTRATVNHRFLAPCDPHVEHNYRITTRPRLVNIDLDQEALKDRHLSPHFRFFIGFSSGSVDTEKRRAWLCGDRLPDRPPICGSCAQQLVDFVSGSRICRPAEASLIPHLGTCPQQSRDYCARQRAADTDALGSGLA